MLKINNGLSIDEGEVTFSAIRSQGAGGQNVNKVATAVHLRFDIRDSSLPEEIKERLLKLNDQRITSEGVVVIKSQAYRSQEKNKQEALSRLVELVREAARKPKPRKPTKPSLGARRRRLESKERRGKLKALRGRIKD